MTVVTFSACVLWAKWFVTCLLKTFFGVEDKVTRNPTAVYITASSTVLQKRRFARQVMAFPYFYETQISLPWTNQSASGPYHEPDE